MATKGPRVAIYDRWHRVHPQKGASPCRCSRGKNKLYPSADHEKGMRWQVRWTDDEGEGQRRNFAEKEGDNPELHAEAFAAKTKRELDDGSYVDPSAGEITVRSYCLAWFKVQSGDPTTLGTVRTFVSYICSLDDETSPVGLVARKPVQKSPIEGVTMKKLARTPSLVQKWVKYLQGRGFSDNTTRIAIGTLSTIFKAAIDDGIVSRNPTESSTVKRPSISKKKVVIWTAAMCEKAATDLGDHGLVVYLGAGAGLRQGEIFGFAVEDYDPDLREITVSRQVRHIRRENPQPGESKWGLAFSLPKGKKQRTIPVSDALARRIEDHITNVGGTSVTLPWQKLDGPPHTAELLFATDNGKALCGTSYGYTWSSARKAAGAPADRANGMHVLRHTAATTWLVHGVDISSVAEYLGHSSISTTLTTYIHYIPHAEEKARSAMDSFLSGSLAEAVPEVEGSAARVRLRPVPVP